MLSCNNRDIRSEERMVLAKQQTLNGKSANGNGANLGFEAETLGSRRQTPKQHGRRRIQTRRSWA